jgi:hypothetical protein
MDAQLESVELEVAAAGDDEFAVKHALFRELFADRVEHLGEIAVERFFVATLEEHFVTIAENEDAKAIPLGLVDPVPSAGIASTRLASIGNTGGLTARFIGERCRQAGRCCIGFREGSKRRMQLDVWSPQVVVSVFWFGQEHPQLTQLT